MKVQNILLLVALLFSNLLMADDFNESNKKGFKISPAFPTSNQLSLKSGDTTVLKGTLCALKIKNSQKKSDCYEIDPDQIEVKAFFPDATNDVSNSIIIDKKKQWSYSFLTPKLSSEDTNTFTILVGKVKPESSKILKIQAKLIKRIQYLERKIESLESKKNSSTREHLKSYLITLKSVQTKINNALEEDPSILARFVYPLQVDNTSAGPLYYSSIFGGYKFSIESPLSPVFEGGGTKATARIVNLRADDLWFPKFKNHDEDDKKKDNDHKHRYFSLELAYQGKEIQKIEPFELPFGVSKSFEIDAKKLKPFSDNSIEISLNRIKENKHGKKLFTELWGGIGTLIPVAEDKIAPKWTAVSPQEDLKYVVKFPHISGTISDSFGRIDKNSLKLIITAKYEDGKTQVFDRSDKLSITTQDDGISYQVDATITEFNEGSYIVELYGTDKAGNAAFPNPVVRSFAFDRTPPELAFLNPDNVFISNNQYVLKASVVDHSETTTRVFQNDVLISTTTDKIINLSVTLNKGTNTFRLESIDAAGNIATSIELKSIVLDFTPPIIAINNQDNQILGNANYNLNITVTDQSGVINKIFQNGINIHTTNQKIFNFVSTLREGINTFEIQSIDDAGNIATPSKLSSITLDTINPVISLNQQGGILTNKSDFVVSGSINDSSAIEYSIYLNGILAKKTNGKNFSYSVSLKEGQNSIEIKARDQVGNEAIPVVISNITLDTVPPTLNILEPAEGSILQGYNLLAKVSSNEQLESAQINGDNALLSVDKNQFERLLNIEQDGSTSIVFRATDLANNSSETVRNVTIDNTPPEVTILSRHGFDTIDTNYLFKLNINELHNVQTQIFFNGVLLSEGAFKTYEKNLILKEGSNSFLIKVVDQAGNSSEYQSRDIVVDSIAPIISSTTEQNILTNNKSFNINATFSDNSNVRYELIHDGLMLFFDYEKTLNRFVSLKEGTNNFIIKAYDLAGNQAQDLLISNITLDTTRPQVSSQNKDNFLTNQKSLGIQASIIDVHIGETVILQNDIEVFKGTGPNISFTATLKEGKNDFIIKSTDLANNKSEELILRNITFNNTKPIIASTNKGNVVQTHSLFVLNARITDDLETNTIIKHNSKEILKTADKNISLNVLLTSGSNSFEIVSTDSAGNVSDTFVLANINLDDVGPLISSDIQSNQLTKQKNFTITANIEDVSNVDVKVFHNGNLVYTGSSKALNIPISLSEGQNTFEIQVSDLAGNQAAPFIIKNIVLDTVKPIITSNTAHAIKTRNPLYFVNASAYDVSGLTFKLLHNGQVAYSVEGSFLEHTLTLMEGINKLEFTAVDLAGNISDPYILSSVILDSKPPVIYLASTSDQVQQEETFRVEGSVSDQTSFTYQLFQNDALVFEGSDEIFVFTATLSPGENNFKLVATDELGNSSFKVIDGIYKDSIAPVIELGKFKELTKEKFFSVLATIKDASNTISEIFQNGTLVLNTTSKDISKNVTLIEGQNTFRITSKDIFGNITSPDKTFSITSDTKAPDIRFNPASGSSISVGQNPNVVITISDTHNLDHNRLRIRFNGAELNTEEFSLSKNENSSQVTISLKSPNLQIFDKQKNTITVEASDILNNISVASADLQINKNLIDDQGPMINFNPGGGIVEAPLASLEVGFRDNSPINFSSLSVTVNGVVLPSNKITLDQVLSKAILNLNSFPQTEASTGLVIEVKIRDSLNNNSSSKVGINFFKDQATLMAEITPEGLIDLAVWHTCVVLKNGDAKCWGDNSHGQIGLGFTSSSVGDDGKLHNVPNISLGKKIKSIETYESATCALVEDGNVFCWGNNTSRALGYPQDYVARTKKPIEEGPIQIGEAVKQFALGNGFSCALLESGSIKCWGQNSYGQLGLGNTIPSDKTQTPINYPYISMTDKATAIEVGRAHACAILESGYVKCWGSNSYGQLGLQIYPNIGDNETLQSIPTVNLGEKAIKLSLGDNHSCALLESGNAKCWGENDFGQLGHNGASAVSDPSRFGPIEIGEQISVISAGSYHTCAVSLAGSLYCWGNNNSAQLGKGNVNSYWNKKPFEIGPVQVGQLVTSVSADGGRTCAVLEDHSLKCWGSNHLGSAGGNHFYALGDDEAVSSKGIVPTGISVKHVSANYSDTCITTINDNLRCWGHNFDKRLGYNITSQYIGDNEDIDTLSDLPANFKIKKLSSTLYHSCALTPDGKVYCWGDLSSGEGGLGTQVYTKTISNAEPAKLGTTTAKDISVGSKFSCALMTNGDVRCMGQNNFGQLGLGNTQKIGDNEQPGSVSPVALGAKAIQITTGQSHACALLENGNVKCWGANFSGELGYGHTNNIGDNEGLSSVGPVPLDGPATYVSSGWNHTCAALANGKISCWGQGRLGQLGNGGTANIGDNEIPTSIPGIDFGIGALKLITGEGHSCALLIDGKVKCWGNNGNGQLGIGNKASRFLAVGAPNTDLPLGIKEISAGRYHSCALLENGDLHCWGSNAVAQLGHPIDLIIGEYQTPDTLLPISLGTEVIAPTPPGSVEIHLLAHFVPDFYYGQGPLEVTFNAMTSYSSEGEIETYQWNFGDGSPVQLTQGPFVTHIFDNQGVFTVELIVTDARGNSVFYKQYISVLGENILPIAKLRPNVTSGPAPLSVTFDGTGSFDPVGNITYYKFIFGNGNTAGGSEPIKANIYTNPGHYSAKLEVTDNNGGKTTSEPILIKVEPHPSAPIISSDTMGNIRTPESAFKLMATIEDTDSVVTKILHNGNVIYTGNTTSINQDVVLVEGHNYFEIQAVDEKGHAAIPLTIGYIVLDTDIPKIASTIKSDSYTNKNPFPLDIQVTDSTRTDTKVFLNGNLVITSQSEKFLANLNLNTGVNRIEIIATDEFGSTSAPFVINNLVLDQASPILSNIIPVADSTTPRRNIAVSANSNEVLSNVSVNGIAMNLSSDKLSFNGELGASIEGEFALSLIAKDRAGNETKMSFKTIVDTLPPDLRHSNASGYLSSNSTYTINANVNDLTGATTEIYHNGRKVYTTTDANIAYNATLSEGANTFVLKSYDSFGNETNPSYIGDIKLDSTIPQIVSNNASDLFTNRPTFNLTYSVLESGDVTSKVFKNGTEVHTSTSKSVSTEIALSPGLNNFQIKATDAASNEAIPVSINNIFLDQVPPKIALTETRAHYTTDQSTYVVSGNVTDEISVETKFVLNGETFVATDLKTFTETIILQEGINNIEVIAEDAAGNISVPVSLREIGLDTLAPVISSSLSGEITVYAPSFMIDVKVTDFSKVITEVFVNGESVYLNSNKEFTFNAQLKPGRNIITAISTDSQNKKTAPFKIVTVTYDDSAPVIKLATVGDIYTNNASYRFQAIVEDTSDVINYIYLNDVLTKTDIEKNIDLFLSLKEGRNNIKIKSDEIGSGRSTVEIIENITLDTVRPVITTSSPQNITTNKSFFTLSIVVQDSIGTNSEVYLNNKLTYKTSNKDYVAPIVLASGRNDIRIEAKDLAGNIAVPIELKNIVYETSSSIATTIGIGGGKHSVTDTNSSIYGSMVDIGPGALNESVNLNVTPAQLSDLPNIAGVPTPEPIGPILNISVSKAVSADKTFNKEVVVGIPFSPIVAVSKNINSANISIVRYDSVHGVVESIRPFKIDYAKGIAYGYTNSFSHFFVSSGKVYSKIALELPQNCRKLEFGYSCNLESKDFNLSGVFRLKGLLSESDLQIICNDCSTLVTTNKNLINVGNEKLIALNLTGSSSSAFDTFHFTFKAGNLIVKEKIAINYSVTPQVPSESILLSNCYEPGAICKEVGTGSIAYSNDGSLAIDSSLNIAQGNINRANKFKLKNFVTKHDGILYWIEPKNNLPNYKIQDLYSYRLNEFTLRRKNLDGTISTVDAFTIAIDSSETLFNEWEYNFNLQVLNQQIIYTLDASNHIYDSNTDSILLKNTAKLISMDENTLVKSYLDGYADFVLKEIKEVKAVDTDIYVIATSFNNLSDDQYKEGLFKYDLVANNWDYLTKTITNTEYFGSRRDPNYHIDGNNILDFDGRNLANINIHKGSIYFIDAGHNCLRRFDGSSSLKTVAGICNGESEFKGSRIDYSNANPTQLLLGDLKSAEIDNKGNILISQNIDGNMELSLITTEENVIMAAIKETSSNRLPASGEALRIDSVKVALDQRDDSKINIDNDNNLYFYNNSCIYNITDPYEYLLFQLSFEKSDLDLALNDANLSSIILSTQNRDGFFSFDHNTNNVGTNLSDTVDALKFIGKSGSSNPDVLNKAQYWVSNQNFNDTKNAANQLETLALLAKQNGNVTLTPAVKDSLSKFLKGFRPEFGGWGSTKHHIINNEDTSAAIRAIALVFNQIPSGSVDSPIYLSEFISPLREIINEQFPSASGVFGGGFGPTNNQNMPTLHTTLGVIDGFLEYKKLNHNDDKIIAWNRKNDFQSLAFNEIPTAVLRSLVFIRSYKKIDGSFGDLKTTVKVLNTFNEIVKGGITSDPTILESLKTDIMRGIAFIKTQDINKASAMKLANLSALDSLSNLGKTIVLATNEVPTSKATSRIPASVDTKLFGRGSDGVLSAVGEFNLNQLSSGDRKHADSAYAKVTSVIKKYVYVENIAEGALVEDDEVLIINLQGTEAGSYKFARVNNIFYNESPMLIELDYDIVADGFRAGPDDKIMIQRVPNYSGIAKSNAITLKADSFNGEVGGVVAFRVQGEFPENVSIDVSGLGFRGGFNNGPISAPGEGQLGLPISPYYEQMKSCSGDKAIDGFFVGGGGSYATSGSFLETTSLPAKTGTIIGSAELSKLFLGCGGGSGLTNGTEEAVNGGNGGGIALVYAHKLTLKTNSIKSNGLSGLKPSNEALVHGAGGGSGGSIVLNVNELIILGNKNVNTTGGRGSNVTSYPGQNGGEGRIRINAKILNGATINNEQKIYIKQKLSNELPYIGVLEGQ